VYGFGMAAPARVEFFGDEIASLRTFDLDSQRSGEPVVRVSVLPVTLGRTEGTEVRRTVRASLLDLLPAAAIVLVDQESAVAREVERAWADAAHHLEVARRLGEDPPDRADLLLPPDAWRGRLERFARLAPAAPDAETRFPIAP